MALLYFLKPRKTLRCDAPRAMHTRDAKQVMRASIRPEFGSEYQVNLTAAVSVRLPESQRDRALELRRQTVDDEAHQTVRADMIVNFSERIATGPDRTPRAGNARHHPDILTGGKCTPRHHRV